MCREAYIESIPGNWADLGLGLGLGLGLFFSFNFRASVRVVEFE